ncbi:MAG TPA: hypothetical protein VKX46_04685 [Ktedonobacteraceae bacterium]|nr:hypothetical protein [Ktedonobacteraceae bacterium]
MSRNSDIFLSSRCQAVFDAPYDGIPAMSCGLTPAAFAAVFHVLSNDARSASFDNTLTWMCEQRSCERSTIEKMDTMGVSDTLSDVYDEAILLQ